MIDHKKVNRFLKGLNGAEYRYLALTMKIVDGLNEIIKNHNLDKKDFCEKFEIKESQYSDFTKGNWNYDLHDIARLNVISADLDFEKMKRKTLEFKDAK